MITRKNFLIGAAATAATASAIECECIEGSWGRARGLMGGAFMGCMMAQQGASLDISTYTQLTLAVTSSNRTYGFIGGVLKSGSVGCTVYWDALGDATNKTVVDGDPDHVTHTYDADGEYVVAISDDLQQLVITGNDVAYRDYSSQMLKRLRLGDSVLTCPSPGGGATEFLYFRNDGILEYADYNNATGTLRPCWGCSKCETLIINHASTIATYGLQSMGNGKVDSPAKIYCDSLTSLAVTALNGTNPHCDFIWSSKSCADIMQLTNVLRPTLYNASTQRFFGTDGYIQWDGTQFVIHQFNDPQ